jgi:hypothetical protein
MHNLLQHFLSATLQVDQQQGNAVVGVCSIPLGEPAIKRSLSPYNIAKYAN